MKKLNKKKGFTLVELLVVIAIIGVLAAILVPTMLGYVTRSHVSNANTAAGKMRDFTNYFLTQADSEGYGMCLSRTAICEIEITVTNGVWSLTNSNKDAFVKIYTTQWTGSGSASITNPGSADNAEDRFAYALAQSFGSFTDGFVKMRLVGGICTALYVTMAQNTAVSEMPDFGDEKGWAVEDYEWNHVDQGVTPSGIIVGTSPLLFMSE